MTAKDGVAAGPESGQGATGRWGHTTHRRRFKDSELIVNIQDSHANLDAQTSIGRVLDEFGAAYDIGLIGLEGSEGRLDTDLVAEFPDERVRADVAENLLKKTMISAAEYRNILQGGGVELFGVEDEALYRRNVRDYQRLLSARPSAREHLARVRRGFEPQVRAALPPVVPEIHRMSIDHAAGKIKFAEYWERMGREASAAGIRPSGYDAIASLASALELEKTIDFGAAAAEREAAIRALKEAQPAAERARFLKELVLFKTGKMRAAQAHRLLLERAGKFVPDVTVTELKKYAAYLALYEKIDLAALFVQIRTFERELISALLTGTGQRAAYARLEMLDLLERLLEGELTPDDHRRYLALRSSAGLDVLRDEAADGSGTDWALLARAERTARGFYGRVEARNRAMLERLTARMREKGVRTAALVTGGFHAEGLSGLMERGRISHVVVLPHFDASGPERPYAAVITSKGSYLDRGIREAALAEVIATAVWSASVQGMSVPRAKSVIERSAKKIARRQADEGRPSNARGAGLKVSPAVGGAQAGGAPDQWIGTSSVLAGVDARSAAQMARTAEVSGDRIRVGGYVFKGLTAVSTTEAGVRRRKASVRWVGRDRDIPVSVTAPAAPAAPPTDAPVFGQDPAASYAAAVRAAGEQMSRYSGSVTDRGRLNAEFDALLGMTLRKKGLDPDRMPVSARELAEKVRTSSVGRAAASREARQAAPELAAARMSAAPAPAPQAAPEADPSQNALKHLDVIDFNDLLDDSNSQWITSAPDTFKIGLLNELVGAVRAYRTGGRWREKGEIFWPEGWSFEEAMDRNGFYASDEFAELVESYLIKKDDSGMARAVRLNDLERWDPGMRARAELNFKESVEDLVEQFTNQDFRAPGLTPGRWEMARKLGFVKAADSAWNFFIGILEELVGGFIGKAVGILATVVLFFAGVPGVLEFFEGSATATWLLEYFRVEMPEDGEAGFSAAKVFLAVLLAVGGWMLNRRLPDYGQRLERRVEEAQKEFFISALRRAAAGLEASERDRRARDYGRRLQDLLTAAGQPGRAFSPDRNIEEDRALFAELEQGLLRGLSGEDWHERALLLGEWIASPDRPFRLSARFLAAAVAAEAEDAEPGFLDERIRRAEKDRSVTRNAWRSIKRIVDPQSSQRFIHDTAAVAAAKELDGSGMPEELKRVFLPFAVRRRLAGLETNRPVFNAAYFRHLEDGLRGLDFNEERYQGIVIAFGRTGLRSAAGNEIAVDELARLFGLVESEPETFGFGGEREMAVDHLRAQLPAGARMAAENGKERRLRLAREREEAKSKAVFERASDAEHHWKWLSADRRAVLELERFDPSGERNVRSDTGLEAGLVRTFDLFAWVRALLSGVETVLRWAGVIDPPSLSWDLHTNFGRAPGAGHGLVHFKVLEGHTRELRGYVTLDVETDDGEVNDLQTLGFMMSGSSRLSPTQLESLVAADHKGLAWAAEDFLNAQTFAVPVRRAGARLAAGRAYSPSYIDYSAAPEGPSGARLPAPAMTAARLRAVVALRGITDHSADDKEFNFMILSAQLQNYLMNTKQHALAGYAADWHEEVVVRLQQLESRIVLSMKSKNPVRETFEGLDRLIRSVEDLSAQAERSLKGQKREVRSETRKRIQRVRRLLETRKDYLTRQVTLEPVGLDSVLKRYGKKLIERLPKQLDAAKSARYRIAVRRAPGKKYQDLWVDTMSVKRVMAEIVRNAFKYGAHKVTVKLDRTGDQVTVRFEDDGPGIPKELLAGGKLFRYGVTTGGTGLGLHEARELARSHGGDLTAVNLKPRGAAFILTIDTSDPSAARMAAIPDPAMLAFSAGEIFTPAFFIALAAMTGIAALVRAALTAKHPSAAKTSRAVPSVSRPRKSSRTILSVFVYGAIAAAAVMALETWYFSRTKAAPVTAEYGLLTGINTIRPQPRAPRTAVPFDPTRADEAVREWVELNPLVRQKVHDHLNTLAALEAQIGAESADIAGLEAEAKKLLADQAAVLSALDAMEARGTRSEAAVQARQQDVAAAAETLKQLEQTLKARRTAVRALATDDPETQDRRARILEARAAAETLRTQASEAEKSASTSGNMALEYKKGRNFFRRLIEGFSIGAKGPVPEISFSPFSGMTERRVSEAGSRGQQAEALVRAEGAREQAAILDQAASAQEAGLRAYETVRSVTADDARDPEIGTLLRDLYDVDKEMRAAGEALAGAKADIEAAVSEKLALVARQAELLALEAGRLERLKAARQKLDASRARQRVEGERLIVLAGQAVHDPSSPVFFPELAETLLGIGTDQSDGRLLPFASGLLMRFEELFAEAVSNPAQREAAQRLTDSLTAYFGTALASQDPLSRQSAQNLLRTLKRQMDREQKERPLSSAILEGLLAPAPSAAAPASAGPSALPVLLNDPGLEDRWSVSNAEHREEWSQIRSVLEPISKNLSPSQRAEIRAAFESGNLASVMLLANSNNEKLAIGTVRQISAQPEHHQLLFRIARDRDASSRIRAAAIEGLAVERASKSQRLAASDPVLRLLDELITAETKDPATMQPASGDPVVLSRLARLAGTLSPSQALPLLERILRTGQPAPMYAAILEIRAQTPHPDAVRPLLDTLASGPYSYNPMTRERVLNGLGLWSDRSPVQQAAVEAVLDLSARFSDDPVVRAAIDEHHRSALKEHRLGFVEYVLNPARDLADPARPKSPEDIWSGTGVWFYNRLDLFAAVVLSVAGLAALLAMSRKVRRDVEGERAVPPVRDYDDPHHPGPSAARMASLDLERETEHILMQSLDRRFGPANAEMIRVQLGHDEPPSDDAGWMDLFPDFGSQILSELRSIETNPIDLIEFRVQEWERILDADGHVSPGELSASIFSLVQQLMIRLPRKFDYRNFYMKLDDTRDGVINIRMVARTVNALSRIDELLRREWKMTLDGRTSVLDRDQRIWALMALQRQFMKAYRAFGAAQELFEIAHVAQTYNDYRMHPWLMRLFVFEKVRRVGVQLLAHGPRDPKRPHLKGVLDDYYRAVGRVVAADEIERDVVQFFDEFTDEYQRELEEARKQGFVLFTGRVVGRRYRRLITVLMPAVGIAAGFLLGGPVFGLPALFRAFFLGSLGILASRWIHSESFYKPLMLNYEHYVSTVVDMLAERNRLFAAKFHISEYADNRKTGTYIESDDFVTKMLLNSTQERRRAVINLVAADRPADLLIVMVGDPADQDWRGVQRRVLEHDLIARSDTPVVFVPDDPELKGSYYAFLKAHSYLAGGVSTAEVVQRFLTEPWFRDLNAHLLDASGTAVRDEIRDRLLRDHHRKIRPSENPARVGIIYTGGGPEHRDRVADHIDEAVVRLHAGLLWSYHTKSFSIASEYADGRYAGPLPFYDHTQMADLRPGEVLIPLTWVSADQVDRERSAVFLPDRTGRSISSVIPGGLNADERRTRMNRAWMTAESPYTKFQIGSDAAQFLTDSGTFFFAPTGDMLEQLRAQRDRILTDPVARLNAQREDENGYTIERFFIGSLDPGSRVRLRTALAPPDATRYEHSSAPRLARRSVSVPPPAPRAAPAPRPSISASVSAAGPSLTFDRTALPAPVPPVPVELTSRTSPLPTPSSAPVPAPQASVPLPPAARAQAPAVRGEPYKVQVRLDGAVVLSQPGAAVNGQPVALKKLIGGAAYAYSMPDGTVYELRWSDPEKTRLTLTRGGSSTALAPIDAYTLQRLKVLLPSGARFALMIGVAAGSHTEYEQRARAVVSAHFTAGVRRPIDTYWVRPGSASAEHFLKTTPKRDKILLDEGAFEGGELKDPQGFAAAVVSIISDETRSLETLLRFIAAAETRGEDLDGAAIDAWMDLAVSPGSLPRIAPMEIAVRPGGYTFRASAHQETAPDAAAAGLTAAFNGARSYSEAAQNALSAVRSLEHALRGPAASGAEAPSVPARDAVRSALQKFSGLRRAAMAERMELDPRFGPGSGESGGTIYIEEALFMENQTLFESENLALEAKLVTAGKEIRRAIVAEPSLEWDAVPADRRREAFLAARNIRGDFDVVFADAGGAGHVLGDGQRRQALLARIASPLANAQLPPNTAVIEPYQVDEAAYTGVLVTAARLLIEGNDRLPGMKKFADNRYFYLPPLSAGALLRAVIGARLSAEAAATSA